MNVTKRKLSGHWQGSWTPERIADLAADLLEENDFNVGLAARALARKVEEDEQLWTMLMRGAVEERAMMAVRFARAKSNRNVHRNAPTNRGASANDAQVYRDNLAAMKEKGVGLLDTFQLPDGTYLRDATRDQILAAAEFYREQANELTTQARWMRLIAQKVPPGQKVAACFNEARIEELQALAERENDDDDE